MRQIKFRAWNKTTQKIGMPLDFLTIDGATRLLNSVRYAEDSGDEIILMQFTRLLDKNGKEIYEGDIVNWGTHINKIKNGDVYFDKGRFWVKDYYISSQDEVSDAFGEGLSRLEIIGNIYSNPELLN